MSKRSPITWVPTLYFAEGLPFFVVAAIVSYLFKDMGIANDRITFWVNALGWAWVWKPLWSPFIEAVPSKKRVVVACQYFGAATLTLVALSLQLPAAFGIALGVLALTAFGSATHDIAADGLYIASLSEKQQAEYAGWQGAFYNAARLFARGGMLSLVGLLQHWSSTLQAWALIFFGMAGVLALTATYHLRALPDTHSANSPHDDVRQIVHTLGDVIIDFFRKPGIWFAILFIILFRAGEGQVQSVGPLFLRDTRAAGGLGLSIDQIGVAYGTAATVAFVVGSIAGGYFTAWLGLHRAMAVLVLVMNLPNLVYWWLSMTHPTSLGVIAGALSLEMFGYGFGFVGVILFIMQVVAVGRFTTAHYALGTGVMQLGFILSGTFSGAVQLKIGYERFFLWTVICAAPVFVLSFFLPRRPGDAEPTADQVAEKRRGAKNLEE